MKRYSYMLCLLFCLPLVAAAQPTCSDGSSATLSGLQAADGTSIPLPAGFELIACGAPPPPPPPPPPAGGGMIPFEVTDGIGDLHFRVDSNMVEVAHNRTEDYLAGWFSYHVGNPDITKMWTYPSEVLGLSCDPIAGDECTIMTNGRRLFAGDIDEGQLNTTQTVRFESATDLWEVLVLQVKERPGDTGAVKDILRAVWELTQEPVFRVDGVGNVHAPCIVLTDSVLPTYLVPDGVGGLTTAASCPDDPPPAPPP